MPGVPKPMRIILAPIELNIHQTILFNDTFVCKYFAGHIVLMSIIGLMFIFKVG
jgi:F-type H+-transporting ATPase subunit a